MNLTEAKQYPIEELGYSFSVAIRLLSGKVVTIAEVVEAENLLRTKAKGETDPVLKELALLQAMLLEALYFAYEELMASNDKKPASLSVALIPIIERMLQEQPDNLLPQIAA